MQVQALVNHRGKSYHKGKPSLEKEERALQTTTASWAGGPYPTWQTIFCAVKEQNSVSYLAHWLVSFYSSVSSCGWVSAMGCLSFLSSSAASSWCWTPSSEQPERPCACKACWYQHHSSPLHSYERAFTQLEKCKKALRTEVWNQLVQRCLYSAEKETPAHVWAYFLSSQKCSLYLLFHVGSNATLILGVAEHLCTAGWVCMRTFSFSPEKWLLFLFFKLKYSYCSTVMLEKNISCTWRARAGMDPGELNCTAETSSLPEQGVTSAQPNHTAIFRHVWI